MPTTAVALPYWIKVLNKQTNPSPPPLDLSLYKINKKGGVICALKVALRDKALSCIAMYLKLT